MRYVISALAILAALCLMGASGLMNYQFWLSQGQSEREANVLGSVSVAFDIFKCVLPMTIALAWARKKRAYVVVASAVFALFFCFSFLSALGFAAGNRGNVSGGRESLGLRLEAASAELENAKIRLKEIGHSRAHSVIEAEITLLQQDRFWRGSSSCNWPSGGEAQNYCKGYFAKRAELASAVEADRLTKRVSELTAEIQNLKSRGAGGDKDPQAGMLAVLSGLSPDKAQKALIVSFAFLVELGAAFGLFLATAHSFGECARTEGRFPEPSSKTQVQNLETLTIDVLEPRRLAPVPLRLKRLEDGALIVEGDTNRG